LSKQYDPKILESLDARINHFAGPRFKVDLMKDTYGASSAEYKKAQKTLNAMVQMRDDFANGTLKRLQDPNFLYKVDLPDEHIAKMLDWDKPLSQQAPEVKKAIDALKKANPEGYAKLVDMQMGGPLMDQATGRDLYRAIGHDPFPASGIPGIRYLDGGSRGAGTGTSNYVVFPGNEDILKILERNGQGLLGN
jgi:hypothetical protein